jgi:membrane protease subunit HflC
MARSAVTLIVLIAIGLLMLNSILFEVRETEQVVITQFGKPVRVIKDAGLYAKLPDPVQSTRRFDKRLLLYDVKPSEFLTADKKNLILNMYHDVPGICARAEYRGDPAGRRGCG